PGRGLRRPAHLGCGPAAAAAVRRTHRLDEAVRRRAGRGERARDESPLRGDESRGASRYLEATYDEYVQRGESENRNKELNCGLGMDRLSAPRFLAYYFRLYLHAAALNLLERLRREIADPPPAPETAQPHGRPHSPTKATQNERVERGSGRADKMNRPVPA